jgi:uncharacterized tellurite resistance protein B-like protein
VGVSLLIAAQGFASIAAMFFRKTSSESPPSRGGQLADVVREHMPADDEATRELVAAAAGLLVCVAYADREFSEGEQAHVREVLARVAGLSERGAEAIFAVLQRQGALIAVGNMHVYTRHLREHSELELRREVLEALLDLAASDGAISLTESDLLRRTASSLGLTQDDYLNAQAKHRDRLSVLK